MMSEAGSSGSARDEAFRAKDVGFAKRIVAVGGAWILKSSDGPLETRVLQLGD